MRISKTLSKTLVKTLLVILSAGFVAATTLANESIATLRGGVLLNAQPTPPRMMPFDDSDQRRSRSYPEQPPTIPHDVEGYRIDLNSNKCLSCHARARISESGAPMISITHFMDSEGQFRAAVTTRRYFCTQCHVSQHNVKPLIENEFVDIDTLLRPQN